MLGDDLIFQNARTTDDVVSTVDPMADRMDKRKQSQRFAEHLAVQLRPSSSSQRWAEFLEGTCKNLSQTGCGVITTNAPRVGDLYRFELTQQPEHPLHTVHARCVRCQMLDEDAFESGFCFLAKLPVDSRSTDQEYAPESLI